VKYARLNPRDSVATNAAKLAALGGGGTNCAAPLELLNQRRAKGAMVIYLSDNQSWMDSGRARGTATMQAWETFRARNPGARLVCIDLQPYGTTQAKERADVLNVGGFSDQVFTLVSAFAKGELSEDHWVAAINAVSLETT
jgi:60 kDa SS-A/Ro ribonucleoprotein